MNMTMMSTNKLAWLDELIKPMPAHQQPHPLKQPPKASWLQRKQAEQRAIPDRLVNSVIKNSVLPAALFYEQ